MKDIDQLFKYLPFLKEQINKDEDPLFSEQASMLVSFVELCYETEVIKRDYQAILSSTQNIQPSRIKEQIPYLPLEVLTALLSIIVIEDERIEGLLQANVQSGVVYELVSAMKDLIDKEKTQSYFNSHTN